MDDKHIDLAALSAAVNSAMDDYDYKVHTLQKQLNEAKRFFRKYATLSDEIDAANRNKTDLSSKALKLIAELFGDGAFQK